MKINEEVARDSIDHDNRSESQFHVPENNIGGVMDSRDRLVCGAS